MKIQNLIRRQLMRIMYNLLILTMKIINKLKKNIKNFRILLININSLLLIIFNYKLHFITIRFKVFLLYLLAFYELYCDSIYPFLSNNIIILDIVRLYPELRKYLRLPYNYYFFNIDISPEKSFIYFGTLIDIIVNKNFLNWSKFMKFNFCILSILILLRSTIEIFCDVLSTLIDSNINNNKESLNSIDLILLSITRFFDDNLDTFMGTKICLYLICYLYFLFCAVILYKYPRFISAFNFISKSAARLAKVKVNN